MTYSFVFGLNHFLIELSYQLYKILLYILDVGKVPRVDIDFNLLVLAVLNEVSLVLLVDVFSHIGLFFLS